MQYLPVKVRRDLRLLGERFSQQRRLLALTLDDVAQRAGVSRATVFNLEHARPVRSDTLLSVANVLQLDDALVGAVDPYQTDLGKLRMSQQLPKRVRR